MISVFSVLTPATILLAGLFFVDKVTGGLVSFYFPFSVVLLMYIGLVAVIFVLRQKYWKLKLTKVRVNLLRNIFLIGTALLTIVIALANINSVAITGLPAFIYFIALVIVLVCGCVYYWLNSEVQLEAKPNQIKWSGRFLLVVVALLFVVLRLGIPFVYSGGFFDEYYHIMSAESLIHTGQTASFYNGELYTRGLNVTVAVETAMKLMGETLTSAKMVPASVGILSFLMLMFIVSRMFQHSALYRTLTLILYTFNPLMIIGHFYIRMYSFYELYLLTVIAGFIILWSSTARIWHKFIALALIIAVNVLNYTVSNDVGKQILPVATAFLFVLLIGHKLLSNDNLVQRVKTLVGKFVTSPILLLGSLFAALAIAFVAYRPFLKILGAFVYGTAEVTSGSSYSTYFFITVGIFTILFLLGVWQALIDVSKRKLEFPQAFVLLAAILFAANLIISEDFQTLRGISYFIPLYLVVAVYAVSRLVVKARYQLVLVAALFAFGIVIIPPNFFAGPYIPNELPYTEYSGAYNFAREICGGAKVFNLQYFPFDSEFYGLKTDYTSYLRYDLLYADNSYRFDPVTNKYYTVYSSVPLYISAQSLMSDIQLMAKEGSVCVLFDTNSVSRFIQITDLAVLLKQFNQQSFGRLNVLYSLK